LRSKTELAAKSGDLEALFLDRGVTAAAGDEDDIKDLTREEIQVVKQEGRNREEDDSVPKLTPDTQPRDSQGKFRQVLARLKQNLGSSGLDNAIEKVEEAENLDNAGDYEKAAKSADDLIGIIDRLDAKALNPEALENIRTSAAELGRTIASLPFDFGMEAQKIRYSDVPAPLQDLMEEMISKVEDKIGDEDAAEATADLKKFMSGGDYFNQSEISSQMSKLLRLLT
jgi:hypothetical protein